MTNFMLALAFVSSAANAASLTESWYMSQGASNLTIKNYKAAAEAFEIASELNPQNSKALKSLALALDQQGLVDKTVSVLERYIQLSPNDSEALFRLAEILSWERYRYRRKDSLNLFDRGLKISDAPKFRHKYAIALAREAKDVPIAIVQYKKLVAIEPANQPLRAEYRELLLRDPKSTKEAVAEFEAAFELDPHDRSIQRRLALLRMDYRFDAIRGLSLSDPLIDKNPNDRELLIARGKALSRNGLLAEAESSFRNALKLRETPQLREDLGDLIAQQPNRTKEAVDNYAAILAANPRRFDLQIKIGDLKANSRDGARLAIDHYKKALQLSKNLPRAHAGLSKAYAWLGESDLALYHASLAEKSGYANPKEMASLTNNLMEGREPEIGLEAQLDEKHRSDLFSSRISSGMIAKAHAGYFVDLYSRFGYEYLSSQFGDFSGLRGQGAYIGLQGEFRPSADITVMGGGGLTSLAAGYDPYEFNFSVQLKWQDHKMEFGVLKQLNSDSVTAIQPTTERSTQFGGIRNEIYLLSHQWEEGNLSSKNTMQRAMIQSINGKENQSSEFNCEGEFRFWHVGDRITFLKMGLQTKSFDNAASQSPEHEPVSESYQRFQQLTASGGIRWQIDSAQYLEASTGPLYQTTDPYESEESRAFGALSNIFWQMRSAHEANFRIQFGSTATKAGDKTFQISTTASRLF